jgi:hypothetical protein
VSDTPRTDAAEYESQDEPAAKLGAVDVEFARTLERELTAANRRISRLAQAGDYLLSHRNSTDYHEKVREWDKAKKDKP